MQSNFRLNALQVFLTYPQCDLGLDDVLKRLQLILALKDTLILEYVIAHELHNDGHPHRHVYLKLNKKNNWINANCFDLGAYHGNYQGVRSKENTIKYVTKGNDYITNIGPYIDTLDRKDKKKNVAKRILGGDKLVDLVKEDPSLLFGYKRLKENLTNYFQDLADERARLPPWLPNPWGKLLPTKVAKKKRHYWIFSDQPNLGKTTLFAQPLAAEFRVLLKAGDFTYWNIRGDEECIIIDEYNTPCLKWSTLNSMADGLFEYRVIYTGLRRLETRPIIIILSNQHLTTLYPNMNIYLLERFNVIKLD